jgi:beta-lysine N6-acetyltransferase
LKLQKLLPYPYLNGAKSAKINDFREKGGEGLNDMSHVLKLSGDHNTLEVYVDPFNKRLRVDDYAGNIFKVIEKAETLSLEKNAEKLIFKARREDFSKLLTSCFQLEAVIDRYFLGSDAYVFAKYFTDERKRSDHWIKEDQIVQNVSSLNRQIQQVPPPKEYVLQKAGETDAMELAELYKAVFEVYPTPLNDPEYIKKTMKDGTVYYCFRFLGKIVSAASAEVQTFYKNAELTDCATLHDHRKHGLMKILLQKLEEELKSNGIFHVYTIARALSFGMNAAFHQLGYTYRGRLINNCYIFDKLEDMNVWCKNLSIS